METSHRVCIGDSRDMTRLEDDSVELVVTSPPYPMIEMWDELFTDLSPKIRTELDAKNGRAAFDLMHEELDATWEEISRVLVDGGIACINIGDATRKVDESFRVYQNHARIATAFEELGFEPLPDILWRKPVNSGTKFMGSGMLPPNAYVTLEHEFILVFRNGTDRRQFEAGSDRRYASAYFWEERNKWFSDIWTDITGKLQSLEQDPEHETLRDRSGAYPFEIPYRLINMYSIYGDTVLDPFWGTGTTTIGAMIAGRNSIGYEIETAFANVFEERIDGVPTMSRAVVNERLENHRTFTEQRHSDGNTVQYDANNYAFPVMTKQETDIQLHTVSEINMKDSEGEYVVTHAPVVSSSADIDEGLQRAKIDSLSDL